MSRSPSAAPRTSAAVSTLPLFGGRFPRLAASLLRRLGPRTFVLGVLRVAGLVLVFFHHAGHVHHEVARGEVHHLHALRVATGDADALDRHADDDALLGDQHQLVVGQHFLEGHHVPGLVGALQRDDAAATAVLHAVFIELRPLAHAPRRDGEQGGGAPHHDHVDDVILLVEGDAVHPRSGAAHVAHVLLVEPDAHAVARGEDDVVLAVGHLHVDELVALLNVDRVDARGARVPVGREHRLFHHALLGGEEEVLVLGELPHGHQGGEALVGLHRDAADDRLPPRGAGRLGDLVHLEPVAVAALGEEHQVVVRRRDEQVLDPVVVLGVGGRDAAAAAALPPVRRDREALDVAGVGHGDDHVLFGDQILDRELPLVGHDLGATLVA